MLSPEKRKFWDRIYVEGREWKKIADGAAYKFICNNKMPPSDPDDEDDLPDTIADHTPTARDLLDGIIIADDINEYIENELIAEEALLERGWDWVKNEAKKTTGFQSADYDVDETAGFDELIELTFPK